MKKRIVVEYGEVRRIALLMNCTYETVSRALAYKKDTKLARAIRKMALMRGGVEVGGNEPANNGGHESGLVETV
ncbi:ArsR family transcriptional regulator [uncultured Parabacteroides sp.]|uniref:ArsR family transcriptional regulator n=1 Tax=uncultured Parabacteroides sp. TaxID=512312 RepID=UPI00261DC150|nr:ArsR family transcriptional regulator [uncultured Parabacteroides sp.]